MKTKKKQLPVVFIHVGNPEYLRYTLAQAKINNPGSLVYLIGDDTNDIYEFVEHYKIHDHESGANSFSKLYKHHSANSIDGEHFCFRRWFILKEFMEQNAINQCLYLDSDVLLFSDLQEEHRKYRNCGLTNSLGFSPGFNIFNNLKVINDFCEFVTKAFISDSLYNNLIDTANQQSFSCGNVSDMVAFYEYQKRTRYKVGDVSVITDHSRHDPNMRLSEGFEMDGGIKKVIWIDNNPYCREISSGSLIRFNSLHFQGGLKYLIKDYFRGKLYYSDENKKWFLKDNTKGILHHAQKSTAYSRKIKKSAPVNKSAISDTSQCTSSYSSDFNVKMNEAVQNIELMLRMKNLKDTRKALEEEIGIHPLSPDLLSLYCELKLLTGERDDTVKILSYAWDRWPDHFRLSKTIALRAFHDNNWEEAKKLILDALKLEPTDLELQENLILVQNELSVLKAKDLIEKGDIKEAKKIIEEVLSFNNTCINALNLLAKIYTLEYNFTEAEKNLSLILKLAPENEIALKGFHSIKQKLGHD
ncbi:MAG: hypothetical protein FJ240_12225 [Nitrospira sp.]|nr:hypothetical protein [Nitrospira sp.]